MKDKLIQLYPHCVKSGCIKKTKSNPLEVFENPTTKRCHCKEKNFEPIHFTVKNPKRQSLTFVAIDNCILTTVDKQKRCDWAVFNKDKICFVELKNVRKKSGKRSVASKQLEHTIKMFESSNLLGERTREAYMAIGSLKNTYPRLDSTHQELRLRFKTELQTDLYEGNVTSF